MISSVLAFFFSILMAISRQTSRVSLTGYYAYQNPLDYIWYALGLVLTICLLPFALPIEKKGDIWRLGFMRRSQKIAMTSVSVFCALVSLFYMIDIPSLAGFQTALLGPVLAVQIILGIVLLLSCDKLSPGKQGLIYGADFAAAVFFLSFFIYIGVFTTSLGSRLYFAFLLLFTIIANAYSIWSNVQKTEGQAEIEPSSVIAKEKNETSSLAIIFLLIASFLFYGITSQIGKSVPFYAMLTASSTKDLPVRILYLCSLPLSAWFAGRNPKYFIKILYPIAAIILVVSKLLLITASPAIDSIVQVFTTLVSITVFISLPFVLLYVNKSARLFVLISQMNQICWMASLFFAAITFSIGLGQYVDMIFMILLMVMYLLLLYGTSRQLKAPTKAAEQIPLQATPSPEELRQAVYTKNKFTKREIEVAELLYQGAARSGIAEKLFISEITVDTHIQHIYQKLGVNKLAGFFSLMNTVPVQA
ncbi:MAG: helix-turn-helix transcriptional regulator [Spirochaetaceae bacterium]|jgi:DNA-binding CsgD family transcriptional regulator|nr:helix-turn-helix transcriptional regulator [Spirochaetaceae bacterium]